MSRGIDRACEELIKAKIILGRPERYVAEAVAEAVRLGRLLPSPERPSPEAPLPDVPLHQRGFGVMDEDAL